MTTLTTNWNKKELHTYLFIYCMNADFIEKSDELALIKNKIDDATYVKMYTEYEKDNDFESIQKIQSAFSEHKYSKEQMLTIFNEIKLLFLSDGSYNILERNLMLGLKRLLL